MPKINKPQRQPKSTFHSNTANREVRQKAYNDARWKKMRIYHLSEHPICEECLRHGVVNGGSIEEPLQVHHIKTPFQNGQVNWELFLNDGNLMTVCNECHGKIHGGKEKSAEELIAVLDELLLKDNWNEY